MVTLKDIARECHVSVAVVSRALNPNSDGRVAEKTRERVEEAMRRLHYHRNHAASMLALGRSAAIGVFLPNYRDSLIAELVTGISNAAGQFDFQCRFFFGQNSDDYLHYLQTLQDMGSSGIITYPIGGDQGDELHQALLDYRAHGGRVMVLNSMISPGNGLDTLSVDNEYGGRLAAGHLLSQGCTHFHLLTVQNPSFFNSIRQHGFEQRLTEAGKRAVVHFISSNHYHEYQAEMLEEAVPSKANAGKSGFFAVSDYLALAFLRKLHQLGRTADVGNSIRLVGYDDNAAAAYSIPTLTTIRQPMRELAYEAASRMIGQIIGSPERHEVPLPELIVRES